MTDSIDKPVSVAFWVISGTALLWNLFGLYSYYTTVSASAEDYAGQGFTPEQINALLTSPTWATSATAAATTTGVLGSLMLLMRKAYAVPLFAISLLALLVQDLYVFVLSGAIDLFGTPVVVIQSIVLVVGVALVAYSRQAKQKGILA